ncbi:MAG: amidohydrolase family protein [Planctomycetaceae bacterium]|nr:amidohydrolase family protein [Planctomycetaceae bacterium]
MTYWLSNKRRLRFPWASIGRAIVAPVIACCVCVGFASKVYSLEDSLTSSAGTNAVLIQAEVVHIGDGTTLQPGMVLVGDGKIQAVAESITPPADIRVLRVAELTPGFIDAASSIGIAGGAGELTSEVTPDFVVADALNFQDPDFRRQVDAGITTVHVTPNTDNVIAGFAGLLKTGGATPNWLQRETGLFLSMCNDPTGRNTSRSRPETLYVRQPTNRMGVVWILRSRLHSAQQATATPTTESTTAAAQIMSDMVQGKVRTYAVSRTSYDIETLYRIAKEFGVRPTLVGGDEAYKVLDVLKQEQAALIFTGFSTQAIGSEQSQLRWNTPALLANAKIPFALAGDELLSQARLAHRFGLERETALAAITSEPAKILGHEGRVGKIAAGLDADLVAFQGDPLQVTSALEWVMVDGQIYSNGKDQ